MHGKAPNDVRRFRLPSGLFDGAWFPVVVLAAVFGSTLVGRDRLAFRDVSFFYTPMYARVAAIEAAGDRAELFRPRVGEPSYAAMMTPAVFYPVRRLVWAVAPNGHVAMAWYVFGHLVLASVGMRWLVGRVVDDVPDRPAAVAVAGLAYPMSGAVLFSYCNPPFLVSAAWLPLMFGVLVHATAAWRRVALAGAAAAAMVVAGDPQTAVHGALLIGVALAVRAVRRRPVTRTFGVAAAAAGVAVILSWPQWSVTLREIGSGGGRSELSVAERYRFSVPPWDLITAVSPLAGGEIFPINRRVAAAMPHAEAVWSPTWFAGTLLPLVLLASGWRRLRCNEWFWMAAFAAVAAWGRFGVGFFAPWIGWDDADGGLYDGLCRLLPVYDSFRYPAKWMTAATACGVVAGATALADRITSPWRWAVGGLAVVVAADAAYRVLRLATVDGPVADAWWGPLDRVGAGTGLVVAAAASVGTLFWWGRARSRRHRGWIVACVAAELLLWNHRWVGAVDVRRESERLATLGADVWMTLPRNGVWRRVRGGGFPRHWRRTSDPRRLEIVETSLRAVGFGRWPEAAGLPVDRSMATFEMTGAAGADDRPTVGSFDEAGRPMVIDDAVWLEPNIEGR